MEIESGSKQAKRRPERNEYEVVWPLGLARPDSVEFNSRIADLNEKTIAELCDVDEGAWFPLIREELKRRYPKVNIVEYPEFGNFHGRDEREVIAVLPDKLREHGVDAVITGMGL